MIKLFVLACDTPENNGGIYRYEIDISNNVNIIQTKYMPCDRPMYAIIENNKLITTIKGDEDGSIIACDTELCNRTEIGSAKGKCACHLCAYGNDIYTANYCSGSITRVNSVFVKHEGSGVNAVRQEMPHTHWVGFSDDKKYVLCCDLGLDEVICYDRNLNRISSAKVPDGYGIRHAVFSRDGQYLYALSEMIPAINVFAYKDGNIEFLKSYILPCEHEYADGAAIRISEDGKTLYASLRVENDIAVLSVDGEKINALQKVSCGGDSPRDFNITGKYLFVTNEKTDNIVIFELEKGLIKKKIGGISVPKPLCVVFE